MRIMQDFNDRLVAGDLNDYDEYKDMVIEADAQYRTFLIKFDSQTKCERIQNDHYQYVINRMSKPKEMRQLLNEYLEREEIHPKSRKAGKVHEGKLVLQRLKSLETQENHRNNNLHNPYIEVVVSIVKLFIKKVEPKKHSILLYGKPNSGKTTLLDHCQEIFDGHDNRQSDGRFGMLIRNRQTKASLVIGDEWDTRHLSTGQISETKRMLEGRGQVYEIKHCNPFIAFKDAYFLLATNNIHPLLTKEVTIMPETEKRDREAIEVRLEKHEFLVSYKNLDEVPFSTHDIALALHYLDENLKEWEKKSSVVFKDNRDKDQHSLFDFVKNTQLQQQLDKSKDQLERKRHEVMTLQNKIEEQARK